LQYTNVACDGHFIKRQLHYCVISQALAKDDVLKLKDNVPSGQGRRAVTVMDPWWNGEQLG